MAVREVDQILQRPFPAAAIKQTKQGAAYVDASSVIWRLLQAWGSEWSFEILKWELHNPFVLVHARLIAPDGRHWDAVGAGQVHKLSKEDPRNNFEFGFKSATTDALKVAAHWAGVALPLYGENLEANVMPAREADVVQDMAWTDADITPPIQPRPVTPFRSGGEAPPHFNEYPGFGMHGQKGKDPKTWGEILMDPETRSYVQWAATKERPDRQAVEIQSWLAARPDWTPSTRVPIANPPIADEEVPW